MLPGPGGPGGVVAFGASDGWPWTDAGPCNDGWDVGPAATGGIDGVTGGAGGTDGWLVCRGGCDGCDDG